MTQTTQAQPAVESANEKLEVDLLLEAIYRKYGYDFRQYARASIKRRVHRRMAQAHLASVSAVQHEAIHDPAFFDQLLLDLSVNVTEMFRDPPMFRALRERVLPVLADRPHVRIWHAGCSTGEEVYSMAILLAETGLQDKTRVYATDFNEVCLDRARQGIYSLRDLRAHTANYQKSGGTGSFADYYTARYDSALLAPELRKNVVFADHNLVTDGVFGEMDLILCRNVLIYFSRPLQNRVFGLFRGSLRTGGFLCLGSKESIQFADCASEFEAILPGQRIYRRTSAPASPGPDDARGTP
jgi:chemotaxis protein methyltransferase CheR